ncbi:MAG TPA: septum formation initiator family protein [Acidobacteriaceae bacterium]|nr:septum formation initiator family protein [Acidobacteriaceae bacterium]
MPKNTQRQLIPTGPPSIESDASASVTPLARVVGHLLSMRRKAATVVLASLSLSLGIYAIFGHDGLVAYQQKQRQAQQLQQQILSLKAENERIAAHDRRLQNDRDTIEYEAREQMHYTRPGEVIYTLPETPGAHPRK